MARRIALLVLAILAAASAADAGRKRPRVRVNVGIVLGGDDRHHRHEDEEPPCCWKAMYDCQVVHSCGSCQGWAFEHYIPEGYEEQYVRECVEKKRREAELNAWSREEQEAQYEAPRPTRQQTRRGAGPERPAGELVHVELPASMTCIVAVNISGRDLTVHIDETESFGVTDGAERPYCTEDGSKITDVGAYGWRGAREGAHVHFSNDPVDFRLEEGKDGVLRIIFIPLGGEK